MTTVERDEYGDQLTRRMTPKRCGGYEPADLATRERFELMVHARLATVRSEYERTREEPRCVYVFCTRDPEILEDVPVIFSVTPMPPAPKQKWMDRLHKAAMREIVTLTAKHGRAVCTFAVLKGFIVLESASAITTEQLKDEDYIASRVDARASEVICAAFETDRWTAFAFARITGVELGEWDVTIAEPDPNEGPLFGDLNGFLRAARES